MSIWVALRIVPAILGILLLAVWFSRAFECRRRDDLSTFRTAICERRVRAPRDHPDRDAPD